ncbi:FGGY family of carbohydrate kinases, N-terminal domain [Paramicrobacterium humi]|uniref:FGGY family of carbohydrate kinases, N-terminal domain n=1 Tax=Paramicrobacterium humi TaxID=640635 RepID=A0A1H4LYP4_9MICO|nr:FGGY family of carbohydrate kinases, N-terminal domain [Microbacterium humi]
MIIAHDLGTTGNKASLHDDTGRLLSAVTVSYGAHFADGGVAEQNPDDWWNAIVEATRRLLAASDTDARQVTGLVVSGQMMGAVLLDPSYQPVRPAIIWADTRSAAQTAQLEERIGTERAYRLTGHRINPTYSIEKIMWVRDNEPDVFDRVRHVCVAKDFVVHRLTGRLATDRSDASATNAYEQRAGRWSSEIIAAAGLDERLFPEIVESTDVVGTLTDAAAAATGLTRGTRVVMGGGDGPIAAVGAGIVAPENGAYVCLGTSSWISFASDEPVYDEHMRTMTFDNVVPGSFVPTATMQAGGAALAWINEVLSPSPMASRFARSWPRPRRRMPRAEDCSSCRTCSASAPPTGIPTPPARSSGSAGTTRARTSRVPCSRALRSTCTRASPRSGRRGRRSTESTRSAVAR